MKKENKLSAAISVGICLLLAAGSAGWHLAASAKEADISYQEVTLQHGDLQLTFTGEGTTADGAIDQKAGFDVTAVKFTVEETYAASGDEVAQGDALYKLSDDSVAEAVSYYESAIAKAVKEMDRAKTAYESGKLEAEYTKTEKQAAADSAKELYDAASASTAQKVTDAETALLEAQTQISVYQSNLDQNTYYTDSNVSEKKQAYNTAKKAREKAEKAYQKAKSAYDTAVEEVNTRINNLSSSAETADLPSLTGGIAELSKANQGLAEKKIAFSEAENAFQSALSEEEEAKEEYNEANTSYEKAVSDAAARKEELENSLSSLELAYTNAVNTSKTESVENQNVYETTMLEGEYAQVTYEDTITTLKTAYDTAEAALEELQEEQSALLALEDGTITAAYDGILSAVFYEAGNVLTDHYALVSYSDTETLTVAVEVSQENISKVSVGDTVSVSLMGMRGGNLEGTVTYIAAEATSGRSMSNVTYTVEVGIENGEGNISTDASAYITFTYGELLDVDYILTDALNNIEDTSAVVQIYNEEGVIEEVPVTIGESLERYTVITGGITEDMICLIESDGKEAGENEGMMGEREHAENAERPERGEAAEGGNAPEHDGEAERGTAPEREEGAEGETAPERKEAGEGNVPQTGEKSGGERPDGENKNTGGEEHGQKNQ